MASLRFFASICAVIRLTIPLQAQCSNGTSCIYILLKLSDLVFCQSCSFGYITEGDA
ncbi:MAG: hypothetical protein J6Y35_03185 [Bacteroidales bacterium]|nr:hypothetical protein [Bacteroidales bacterium]